MSAFSGISGVGKSSLLNRIDTRLGLETGEVSQKHGRGRHTTRHVELFELPNGAIVADTPGFSSFDVTSMDLTDKESIQFAFPEFSPYIGHCRFTGCAHVKDQGCACLLQWMQGPSSATKAMQITVKQWVRIGSTDETLATINTVIVYRMTPWHWKSGCIDDI